MTLPEAIVIVTAMRQRCPVRPGSVPFEMTADHRKALTLVLAAAGVEQSEPRQIRTNEPTQLSDLLTPGI